MYQSEGRVSRLHPQLALDNKLIDALHMLLTALHHEGGNPENTVVKHPQALDEAFSITDILQATIGPLDDRWIHSGEIRPHAHVVSILSQRRKVASKAS